MQALQNTIRIIAERMRGLPMTARLLIGSLMIILVMSLLFVAMFAAQPSLVPLATEGLSAADRVRAVTMLKSVGITFEDRGGQLYVPPHMQTSVLASLTDQQVIGGDQIDFLELVKQDNPFMTSEQSHRKWLGAKMKVLQQMISQMTGIDRAMVVIDEPRRPGGIGAANVGPSATVTVTSRSGALGQHQVDAIARAVAKAHAGMKLENVAVIDATSGKAHSARAPDAAAPTDNLELKLELERINKEKFETALGIPGLRLAINMIVDTRREERTIQRFEEPKVGPLESSSDTLSTSNRGGGAEPGVRPNTSTTLVDPRGSTGAAGGSQTSREKTGEKTVPAFGNERALIRNDKGYPLQINATVGVPRSYFVKVFQAQQGDETAEPDEAALAPIVQMETQRISQRLSPLLQTGNVPDASPGELVVDMYYDHAVPAPHGGPDALQYMAEAGGASGSEGSSGLFGGVISDSLVRTVGLGALAVVSLAMMLLMVRKASMHEKLPSAAELVGIPPALDASDTDLVGEADESAPALEGVELDEDELKNQQMLTQINDLVKNTPNEAAILLRKWMRSEA